MQKVSIEQMCRELLVVALRDGLVSNSKQYDDPDPQSRTAGDLAGVANKLEELLRVNGS